VSWVPKIGAEFADYRLDALLGHGGMSIVYRAEHVRLGRKVALKLLSPQLSEDEGFRDRFTRESRLAAALDHPNIIPIYEANEAEGVFFIAMRYVEGADLRALIRRESPLQLERMISIINQTANALTAAHDKGLVHRDVKPANILIDPGAGHDGLDHAYLSDFGVAKQTSAPGFTKTGIFVGTADYASPEQIEGKELDGRADVYSLGCVIYECLTGNSAYDKDSEVALMYAHLLEAPPLVTEKRPDLPAEIDEVVIKAMAKSRDERYQTPKEVASELRRVLSGAAAGSPAAAAAGGGRETVLAGATVSGEDEGSGTRASTPKPGETVVSGGGGQKPARAAAPDEPGRARRSPVLALAVAGVLAAIGLIIAVLALSGGDDDGEPQGAGQTGGQTTTGEEPAATPASLIDVLVPTQIARTCTSSTTAREGALETYVCTAAEGASVSDPNEVELSFFADGQSLEQAYAATKEGVEPVSCTAATGERLWTHPTTGGRGGRRLCFVDQSGSFVIVWTHEKLDAPDHVDMLGIAREPGRSPTVFRTWWNALNDSLGKCRPQVAEDACFEAIQQLTS
jgi:serine/threonine-protein kinase